MKMRWWKPIDRIVCHIDNYSFALLSQVIGTAGHRKRGFEWILIQAFTLAKNSLVAVLSWSRYTLRSATIQSASSQSSRAIHTALG
jgi:hypothetical protein